MNDKARTVALTIAALAVMVGMVAASVPLYSLFCKVTGAGGTPRVVSGPSDKTDAKSVVVRFDGAVMKDMPWRFRPEQTSMTVHLGETNLAVFSAENLSSEAVDKPWGTHVPWKRDSLEKSLRINAIYM